MAIASILGEIVVQRGTTVMVATHDLTLAGLCSRRVDIADGAVLSDV